MKTQANTRPLSNALANVTREICEKLYEKKGPSAVYDYCNKTGQYYHPCEPCEADTPTISYTGNNHTCAICGTNKQLTTTRATYRKARTDRNGKRPLFFYPVTISEFGETWINTPCTSVRDAIRIAKQSLNP